MSKVFASLNGTKQNCLPSRQTLPKTNLEINTLVQPKSMVPRLLVEYQLADRHLTGRETQHNNKKCDTRHNMLMPQ